MDTVPNQKTVSVNFMCAVFSHLDFLTFEMGPTGCPEMLVPNYHATLYNILEEWKCHMMI